MQDIEIQKKIQFKPQFLHRESAYMDSSTRRLLSYPVSACLFSFCMFIQCQLVYSVSACLFNFCMRLRFNLELNSDLP